jgi:hypothetical protein
MSNVIRFFLREGALPMLDGETIDAFREAIVFAIREDYEARGVIGRDEEGMRRGWIYLVDVFDDFAVVEVDRSGVVGPLYEKVAFTRAPDGAFTLGAPSQVRRKVEWVPVEGAEDSVDMAEAIEVPDRERELRVEITTETIRDIRFPVGDPVGVDHSLFRLRLRCEVQRLPLTGAEKGQVQAVIDHTNLRAGSTLRFAL